LYDEFIISVVDQLPRIKIVGCSRDKPEFDPALVNLVEARELVVVTADVIREYLTRKRIRQELLDGAAAALFVSTAGNMLLEATYTEQILSYEETR
jgi:hypothetical protein